MNASQRRNPKAEKALNRKPESRRWLSTDAREIEQRRMRADLEPLTSRPLGVRLAFS